MHLRAERAKLTIGSGGISPQLIFGNGSQRRNGVIGCHKRSEQFSAKNPINHRRRSKTSATDSNAMTGKRTHLKTRRREAEVVAFDGDCR